jgi:hypothetical protein
MLLVELTGAGAGVAYLFLSHAQLVFIFVALFQATDDHDILKAVGNCFEDERPI